MFVICATQMGMSVKLSKNHNDVCGPYQANHINHSGNFTDDAQLSYETGTSQW